MTNVVTVSLVIPTYNRAGLVAQTVQSALNQSIPFDEIIVVDDGSSDDTLAVLDSFGTAIRTISQRNQGVQAARNVGVQASHSKWIAFCDSDDLLCPSYLEKMKGWFSRYPASAVYCNFTMFGDGIPEVDKLSTSPFDYIAGAVVDNGVAFNIPEHVLRNLQFQPLFPSGMMLLRSTYLELGGFDLNLAGVGAEDWDFTLRLLDSIPVALNISPLVRIRRHPGNDSSNSLHMSLGEIKILRRYLAAHVEEIALAAEIERQISSRSRSAFDVAFMQGRNDLLPDLASAVAVPDIRMRVKLFLAKIPRTIRSKLLWFIQAMRGG